MAEKEKLKPVVKQEIKQKQSLGSKIRETFSKENTESVGDYLVFDIIIPWIKDGIVDVVTNGVNMLIYGDSRGGRNKKTDYTSKSKVSYRDGDRTNYSKKARASQDFSDIVLGSRTDALNVLSSLRSRIEEYDACTVADFYDLVDITSNFTDNNYGWTDLQSAYISQVRGGYILVLPKPEFLE